MKTLITATLLIILTLSLISCESEDAADVNQQRIETNYYLTFDENTNETAATAEFKFGSTYLTLSSPSEVRLDNVVLKKEEFLGIVQYSSKKSGIREAGTFQYTNEDNTVYTNTLQMVDPISPGDSPISISVSEGANIAWEGEPVKAGETINLHIETTKSSHWLTTNAVNATQINVPADYLDSSEIGQAEITLERTRKTFLQEAPEEGGYAFETYTSLSYAVEISE